MSQAFKADLAPIAIFAYNRQRHLKRLIESLQRCDGFERSPIFIFVDGARDSDHGAVDDVRAYVRSLQFPNLRTLIADSNKGLRNSISNGVTQVIDEYGRVIVLEDDLVLSPIALSYFNAALTTYADDPRVWSVSGYISDVPKLRDFPRALALPYAHSWGWATWARAWRHFELDARPCEENFNAVSFRHAIDMDGFYPFRNMLGHSMAGRVNSWYAHWLYTIFKHGGRSIFPPRRVLDNYGISAGTHGGALNPHEWLVKRPALLETLPAFEDAGEIDYFAVDLLRRCWEARVQRGVAFAGGVKRRLLRRR